MVSDINSQTYLNEYTFQLFVYVQNCSFKRIGLMLVRKKPCEWIKNIFFTSINFHFESVMWTKWSEITFNSMSAYMYTDL